MYFDAQAVVLTAAIILILVSATVAAHLVWLTRLSRSAVLSGRPGPQRAAILLVACMSPVIGFYVAEVAQWWRKHDGPARHGFWKPFALVTASTLVLTLCGAVRMEFRYLPEDRDRGHLIEVFYGQFGALVLVQLLLFMFVRVFAANWRMAYIAGAGIIVALYSLFIF
ncbi:hypothetical protein N7E02_10805 [Aliirhizobium terrae]|uniref:hypothetical protein n=1 Tax=Terrirhizobium terrae TaxID=2926709 RepID=UPI0025773368|nr:hypothetical protein [Rhizobium sp. CC-CFT758]WJH40994.1 hypothetical protein N7E02_10805 [Rhizobium sp. CC-CFT758]